MNSLIKSNKKRPFTLLEMMIVIMMLALVAGAVSFDLKNMMGVRHFRQSSKRIKEHITRAQLLALIYDADFQVTIKKEKGSWILLTHNDEACLQNLNKQVIKLDGIETMAWIKGPKSSADLIIDVLSNGRVEPMKTLIIKGQEETEYLDFRVPFQITRTKTNPSLPLIAIPPKPEKQLKVDK